MSESEVGKTPNPRSVEDAKTKRPLRIQGSESNCASPRTPEAERGGFEPEAFSAGNTPLSDRGGAESGALDARNGDFDPELYTVTEAWPHLSDRARQDILAIVKTAAGNLSDSAERRKP